MKTKTIAEGIRVEIDEDKDDVYIVFKVIDESFKQKVRDNWLEDVELKLVNKKLYYKE